MDWSIWDCSYYQDVYESSSPVESDFCFYSRRDVVEENVINEKCCIQVLKILIKKADDDIDELEKDLLSMQHKLVCMKSKRQFELICDDMSARNFMLRRSIESLMQSDKVNTEDQLPRQPAEKLYKPANATMNNQNTDTLPQLVGHFYGTSSSCSMKVKSEETEDSSSSSLEVDTVTNDSFLKHKENGKISGKEVEPEIGNVGVCSLSVVVANDFIESEKWGKSVSEMKIEEAKEHWTDSIDTSQKSNSYPNTDGECSLPDLQKQGESNVSRQSDGFSGNKRSYGHDSKFSVESESGDSNIDDDDKLIELFLRNKKKKSNEESTTVPDSNRSASCLVLNSEGNVDDNIKILKTEESEGCDFPRISPSILQDPTRSQTNELDRLLPEDSQIIQSVSLDSEPHLMNMGHKSNALIEKGCKSQASFPKAKKHCKLRKAGGNACVDQPSVKSAEPGQRDEKMRDDDDDDDDDDDVDDNEILGHVMKSKATDQEPEDLSIVSDMSHSCQIKHNNSGMKNDVHMVKSSSTHDDHSTETLEHLPSSITNLKDFTLVNLRTLAKQLKLTRYHKLRKQVLLELLVSHMER